MVNHPNRNWQRRWLLSEDEKTATHETGLIAHFDGYRVTTDDASRDAVFANFVADVELAEHAGAMVAKLLAQAVQLFIVKLPAIRERRKLAAARRAAKQK